MTTTEEAVNQGATLMADAEDALQAAVESLNNMPSVFATLRSEGVIGYLESQRLAAEAQSLAGQIAGARASVFMYHEDLTARSVELDLEKYLPQPRSGGGGR